MKWLEVIEVRTVSNNFEVVEKELLALIEKVNKESNRQSITLYAHGNLKTDFKEKSEKYVDKFMDKDKDKYY